MKTFWLLAGSALLSGCMTTGTPVEDQRFQLDDLVKTDVDMVTEVHLYAQLADLATLMERLYQRNPEQLRRGGWRSVAAARTSVFGQGLGLPNSAVGELRGSDAIVRAFDHDYRGDRVLALVYGLADMTFRAYGSKREFNVLDRLDMQSLYNTARNYEITARLLSSRVDLSGSPYLKTDSMQEPGVERLFGGLIGRQDAMALVAADGNVRLLRNSVQSVARFVFLPI